MKKVLIVMIAVLFLAGCATPHISGRTAEGAAIGAGIGYIAGKEPGAWVGAAIGGGLGHIFGTREEMRNKILVPAERETVYGAPGHYGLVYQPRPGYGPVDCSTFPTLAEKAACEKGKARTEREYRRQLERRAEEYGRWGY